MNIQEELQHAGLTASEIRIYLYLLEQGQSTPSQIAKGTGIARTNGYHVLQSLHEKGLIEEHIQAKRKSYLASDPEALLRAYDRKREMMSRILPDLRALYTVQKNKPKIRFYDGMEQVKEIFLQTLSAQEIHGIASTKQLFHLSPDFFRQYRKEIRERQIVFHDILTYPSGEKSAEEAASDLKGLYEWKMLPKEHEDAPTDILIWDYNVALIVTSEPVFGIILNSAPMAATFNLMFDVMWKRL